MHLEAVVDLVVNAEVVVVVTKVVVGVVVTLVVVKEDTGVLHDSGMIDVTLIDVFGVILFSYC